MPRAKRILHLIQSLDQGGCENMLLRTLPRLTEFEHRLFTLKTAGVLAPQFIAAGLPVTTLGCRSLFDLPSLFRLRRLVRSECPDIIITYLFHADVIGRLALQSAAGEAPVIPFLRTTYNHPRYLIARCFEWLTRPLVRRYFANSEAVKDFYVRRLGVESEKISVIANGIDTDAFDQLAPDPQLREHLGLATDDQLIICVANLHPNKGHRYLLEAFLSLAPQHPRARLLLVGDGETRAELETLVRDRASRTAVRFLGQRTDVPALLMISNVFVLPTLFEGQSNALLEAMAAGLPVITTDIPENRACVEHAKTGWLVPAQDSEALRGALDHMLKQTDAARSIALRGKDFVRTHHSLTSTSEQWRACLRNL